MKDDKFEMGTGQAHELAMAFGRNGWTKADVKKLSEGDMLAQLLEDIREQGDALSSSPSIILASELIPEYTLKDDSKRKWQVIQDVAQHTFDISKLERRSFLKDREDWISGEEMRERAGKSKGNLGLVDGKGMLVNGGKLIPPKFRGFFILLPGTLLCNRDGQHYIPSLGFSKVRRRWELNFRWIGIAWSNLDCFACIE